MTIALRPSAVTSSAVWASPSAVRATSATSAPAWASATAMARPIPRDAPVTKAVLPVRSKRLMSVLPFSGKRPGAGVHLPHNLIQNNPYILFPDPQMLGPLDGDNLRLRHPCKSRSGLIRSQVIVKLGH